MEGDLGAFCCPLAAEILMESWEPLTASANTWGSIVFMLSLVTLEGERNTWGWP